MIKRNKIDFYYYRKFIPVLLTGLLITINCAHVYSQSVTDSIKLILAKKQLLDTVKINLLEQLIEGSYDRNEWRPYNVQLKDICEQKLKKTTLTDKERVFYKTHLSNAISNEGFALLEEYKISDAVKKFTEGLQLRYELSDSSGISNSYNNLGYSFDSWGKPDSAIWYYQQSIGIRHRTGDLKGEAYALSNLSSTYFLLGDVKKALEYQYEAVKIREKIKDKYGLAVSLNNLADLHEGQGDLNMAITYYRKSNVLMLELGNTLGMTYSYINLGRVYISVGKLDSSLVNLRKALYYSHKQKHLLTQITAETCIGTVYMNQNKLDSAKQIYYKQLMYVDSIQDYITINGVYYNIATIEYRLKNYHLALKYASKSYTLSKDINNVENVRNCSELLHNIHAAMANYKEALAYHYEYIQYRDTLKNKDNNKLILTKDLTYRHEKEKLELQKEYEIQEAKNKQRALIQYIVIASIVLILVLVVVFFRSLQKRYKVIFTQKEIIEKQKDHIEHKNNEITQSIEYAQKIQSALLPDEEIFRSVFSGSFILFKPKDIVSGDYYWLSDKEKYTFYATADCTGHGVPGGFMSMLGTALLNEIVDERKIDDCGEVLTLMREKIIQALKQAGDSESKDGMDMVLIRIDKKNLEMQYAAANNSFYVVRPHLTSPKERNSPSPLEKGLGDEVLIEMQCDKMPVGVYHSEVKPFRTFTHQLQKGDIIYTYTDGYADQFGGDLSTGSRVKKYTYKRLREKLIAISQEPLAKQKNILENEFESWKNGQEQIDDVCLIGVKI